MPRFRRRIKRVTMGKDPIKQAHTLVTLHGNGSNVSEFLLYETRTGDRSLDGSAQSTKLGGSTSQVVEISDIIKYVNIVIQTAITEAGQTNQDDTQGWLEWAVVWRNEVSIPIPSTNLGTETIGVLASRMFRGDCLMTGQFPVSVNLPNVQPITIKLPAKAIKQKIGNELTLYFHFRASNSTDLTTDTVKSITSTHFKTYS